MKKVLCKLYRFEELSEDVQKSLIEEKRWDLGYGAMDVNSDEREQTLKEFSKVFGITVKYRVDYCEGFCRTEFDDDAIYSAYDKDGEYYEILADEVSGKLLLRYLNSKFLDLHYPKKYWGEFKWDENGKSITKKRCSRILWEDCCPLTGVCYDEDILEPIRKYLKKPDKTITLKDLIEDCVDKFICSWHQEYEYCCDNDDFLFEEFENKHSEDLFFEDGKKFEGIYEEVAA